MSAVAERGVRRAAWATDLPPEKVAGSLYAVTPELRTEAAAELFARGMPIHIDLILAPSADGGALVHRGVSPEEVRRVRAALPDAHLDLHVILLSGAEREHDSPEVVALCELAAEVAAARVVLPERLAEHPEVSAVLEAAGCETWRELRPAAPVPVTAGEGSPGGKAGTLVMLIEPGTLDAADPMLVERVGELSGNTAVGVDGGVGPELAERALALGTDHVVAGRALFITYDRATGEEIPANGGETHDRR
ncbi:MAG: hypothetical protein ACK5LO_10305 [Leucobacter sp.]